MFHYVACSYVKHALTCLVVWLDEYLSVGSFRASRKRNVDVMAIDASVVFKAENNGPLFCSVLQNFKYENHKLWLWFY